MKLSLPIVTILALLLAASRLDGQVSQRPEVISGESGARDAQQALQAAPSTGQTETPPAAQTAGREQEAAAANGQELVAESAEAVFGQSSISAGLRYRIDIFEQQLLGSGNYWQLGYADHKKSRLELKIQIGEHLSSVRQTCDGRFLWVHRDLPGGTVLIRYDLRRIREALAQSQTTPATSVDANWMALGGLSKLLDGLSGNFEFGVAEANQLQEVPVWVIEGRWRPERLASLVPEWREAILAGEQVPVAQLPAQLPERVRVVLGRDDRFPYRIEYLRRDENDQWKEILTMEFFEVRLGGIPPRRELFVYEPGDQEYFDHTMRMLIKLGLGPAPE